MQRFVDFDAISTTDLVTGAVYRGGNVGNAGDDPIAKIAPVGNRGGLRFRGSIAKKRVRLVAIYMSGAIPEWPDHFDEETGVLTYFGDNRTPGCKILDTKRRGNLLLKQVFEAASGNGADRLLVPPILVFDKANCGRDVRFCGLVVPGTEGQRSEDDLTVVRSSIIGGDFENYKAKFTKLNTGVISRIWIRAVAQGAPAVSAPSCPSSWRKWATAKEGSNS